MRQGENELFWSCMWRGDIIKYHDRHWKIYLKTPVEAFNLKNDSPFSPTCNLSGWLISLCGEQRNILKSTTESCGPNFGQHWCSPLIIITLGISNGKVDVLTWRQTIIQTSPDFCVVWVCVNVYRSRWAGGTLNSSFCHQSVNACVCVNPDLYYKIHRVTGWLYVDCTSLITFLFPLTSNQPFISKVGSVMKYPVSLATVYPLRKMLKSLCFNVSCHVKSPNLVRIVLLCVFLNYCTYFTDYITTTEPFITVQTEVCWNL